MEKINDAYVLRLNAGEHHFLLLSDVHYDSKNCERKLLKRLLDEAKEKNAQILIFGDFFDAMGGKLDPRTSKEDIRPEYNLGGYFDQIVTDAVKFLQPYKDNIILISDGNHELSVKKHQEIDLIERLITLLNSKIIHGKYSGFIRVYEKYGTTKRSNLIWYTHGSGGNAPVTKGVIKTNRRQDQIQADIFISGHIHTEFDVPRTQVRLNHMNNVEIKKVRHYQLGTFLNSIDQVFASMKEFAAPNLGGRWLTFDVKKFETLIKSDYAE